MKMHRISDEVREVAGCAETIAVALTQDEASILYSLITAHVGGVSDERSFLTDVFMNGLRHCGATRMTFSYDGGTLGFDPSVSGVAYIYGRL